MAKVVLCGGVGDDGGDSFYFGSGGVRGCYICSSSDDGGDDGSNCIFTLAVVVL